MNIKQGIHAFFGDLSVTEWIKTIIIISIGAFIMAIGFNYFIDPHNIVPGGFYGLGILANRLTIDQTFIIFGKEFIGFPKGTFALMLNIPLTIIAVWILGPKFGFSTVLGYLLCGFFMDLLPIEPLTDEVLLSVIFGGVLIGIGLGFILRERATTGGTDTLAMIIKKKSSIPIGTLIIILDSAVVLLSLYVFYENGTVRWDIPLFSWVTIYITGKVIDIMIDGLNYERAFFIVSDKYEEVKQIILQELECGGTSLSAKGMYTDKDRKMIISVVSRQKVITLKKRIAQVDPQAFVTVIDANEVLGEGFKPLTEHE